MNKDGRIYVHEEPPEEKEEYIEDKQHKISEKKPKKKGRKDITPEEEEEQLKEKVKTKKKIKQHKNAITKCLYEDPRATGKSPLRNLRDRVGNRTGRKHVDPQ